MSDKYEDFLGEALKEAFETVSVDDFSQEMPKEALKRGTVTKSLRHDRTGLVVDAFYGDLDKDNQKIIVYTLLLLPDNRFGAKNYSKLDPERLYFTNEYEYDIIGYLMIPPLDITYLLKKTNSGLTL